MRPFLVLWSLPLERNSQKSWNACGDCSLLGVSKQEERIRATNKGSLETAGSRDGMPWTLTVVMVSQDRVESSQQGCRPIPSHAQSPRDTGIAKFQVSLYSSHFPPLSLSLLTSN